MQAQFRVGCGLFQLKLIFRNFVFCNDFGERFPTSRQRFKYIMISALKPRAQAVQPFPCFCPLSATSKIALAPNQRHTTPLLIPSVPQKFIPGYSSAAHNTNL